MPIVVLDSKLDDDGLVELTIHCGDGSPPPLVLGGRMTPRNWRTITALFLMGSLDADGTLVVTKGHEEIERRLRGDDWSHG